MDAPRILAYNEQLKGEAALLNNWYQTFLKNKTLSKMVLIYSIIAIVVVIVLAWATLRIMTAYTVASQLDVQERALESINEYLQKSSEYVEQMTYEIYSQPALEDNISFFLRHSYNEYINYRLDQISKIGIMTSDAIDYFTRKMLDNPAIKDIILYGDEKQQLYHIETGHLRSYQVNPGRSYVPGAIVKETATISIPNIWVSKLIGREQERMYSIQTDITHRYNYKTIGRLLVNYDSSQIGTVIVPYSDSLKGNLLVLTNNGQVIYDQSDQYYGDIYPYFEEILTNNDSAVLEEDSWINVIQNDSANFIVSIVPKKEIAAEMNPTRNMIILLAVACSLVIIFIPLWFAMRYTKQMHLIISSMRSVETGKMSIRIPIKRNDELGVIAGSFNQMLSQLTHHINRSYKAEMEQSRAEMSALQARVDPHFLYNTLEVIRMRAVSLGVNEVGDMVYNLANLFRNLVKEGTVVTLRQEVENCRIYLELIQSRYQEDFVYTIHLDPRVADQFIVKLTLQVIVENFIVHGLRDDEAINHIDLSVDWKDGFIHIMAKDNGLGIEPDKLAWIQRSLTDNCTDSECFGLLSVYKRLQYLYGDQCNMQIDSLYGQSTTVKISLPYVKEEE